ncbi:MAG TPA: D-2-hydroxyacid dehydrogenase [Vicinamibacterales bacterium]|nr:D-2-hydroxyacid dehydrogenase [Vicinamibacterales bacterium]
MKVLLAPLSHVPIWAMPADQRRRIIQACPGVTFADVYAREEIPRHIGTVDVAFVPGLTPAEIAAAKALRWVHTQAAGVGHLLSREFIDSPIVLTNSRGVRAPAIAEHVLAMALVLARQIHTALARQRERVWAQDELERAGLMWTLRGRTMGVVGLGAIGAAVARLASAFGMDVIGLRRRTDAPAPDGVRQVIPPDRLPDLLRASDVVVLASALTPATEGLVGAPGLRLMPPHALLVNVGRGGLVREADLIDALRAGVIGGAALDVFEDEPLDPASPLWTLPNVIVSPHVSGATERYWDLVGDLFIENLRRFQRGEALLNVVDKQAGY